MPTYLKRLAVPVDPETHELLNEVSDITGISKSKLLSQMLEQYRPMLKVMRSVHRDLKDGNVAQVVGQLDGLTLQAITEVVGERSALQVALKKGRKADVNG